MKEISGDLIAKGLRFGIIVARFNSFITERLLEGAIDCIKRHGGDESCIDIIRVPGAFEIPLVTQKLAISEKYDAVICLGSVIRGATSHYDYVCNEAVKGISQVSLSYGIPVMFGILTTDTIEQAVERAGTKAGNKGFDSALSAIEMANLLNNL